MKPQLIKAAMILALGSLLSAAFFIVLYISQRTISLGGQPGLSCDWFFGYAD